MGQIDNGNGTTADINGKRELKVFAVTETEAQASLELGKAYNLNSKDVTSMTAGDATLIYLKNDEDSPIIIEKMIIGVRGLTGLTDMAQWTTYTDITGGDLVTDATTSGVIRVNRLGGSSESLKSTTLVYKGKAAGTVTGAEELYGYINNNTRLVIDVGLEVKRGGTYAVKIDSDATAGTAYCALVIHVKDPDYTG